MAKKILPLIAALCVGAGLLYSLHLDWAALFRGDLDSAAAALRAAAERQGPYKAAAVALMVALLPFVLVPITVTLFGAALVLAPMPALAAMTLGGALNTALSWGLGRAWGRGILQWLDLERFGVMRSLRKGAEGGGVKVVILARMLPVPYCIPGVAAGALGLGFWTMILGSFVSMLPWSLLYVFFTEAVRSGELKWLAPALLLLILLIGLGWWVRRRGGGKAEGAPEGLLSPQSPALGPELTLYTLPGHEASREARDTLWALRPRLGFEIRELDLGAEPALHALWADHAPVVFLGQRRLFSFQVDENALQFYLKAAKGD